MRIQAGYNLAWFPDNAAKSLPRLRECMRSAKHVGELASHILSVGLLEFQATVARPARAFVHPLLADERPLMRYAAALYLVWHEPTPEVMAILEKLASDDKFDARTAGEFVPFAEGRWDQYAERLLELDGE